MGLFDSCYWRTFGAIGALSILTSELDKAIINSNYHAELEAAAGTQPYAWSIVSGSLAPGLALDAMTGNIDGIPTMVETAAFTVRVTDHNGLMADAALQIMVEPRPSGASIGSIRSAPGQMGL